MEHVLTIKAFERKIELGGGFRAVVVDLRTRDSFKSDVLADQQSAMFWAQKKAHEIMGSRPYRRASIARRFVGNKYVANIWA